jgi:hypothetical protein
MAAKRKVQPPKPDPNRPWSELKKSEQSAKYSAALHSYSLGDGPNPTTQGAFFRKQAAAEKA